MRLKFRGWQREVVPHEHRVTPVKFSDHTYRAGDSDDPLKWCGSLKALGKVDNLALSGSFLVTFEFESEELRNWLRKFARSEPEAAIRLLSEMNGEALLALAKKTEERAAQRATEELSPDPA